MELPSGDSSSSSSPSPSSSSRLVTANPDFISACSILQYFGRYLDEPVPSHRCLAERMSEQKMSEALHRLFLWLASRQAAKINGRSLTRHLASNGAQLNLTADEIAAIRKHTVRAARPALRLKLFNGLLQQWVFAVDRSALYEHRPADPSLLGTDRHGRRFRFTVDYELTLHVYAEQSATGPWHLVADNADDLLAKCIEPLSDGRPICVEADSSWSQAKAETRLECPLCENDSGDSAIGSLSDTDEWPQLDDTTNTDHQLCAKCSEQRLLKRLRKLHEDLDWLATRPLADRQEAIALLPDQVIVRDAPPTSAFSESLHIEDPHICGAHFRRIYAAAEQRLDELLATSSVRTLKRKYIQHVRPLLETDVHIWQGACSPAQLSQLDRLQERVESVIRPKNAATEQLEPLAMRRDHITVREFYRIVACGESDEWPLLLRIFARRIIQTAQGSMSNYFKHFVYQSAERSFAMRGTQLYRQLPPEIVEWVLNADELPSVEQFEQRLLLTIQNRWGRSRHHVC